MRCLQKGGVSFDLSMKFWVDYQLIGHILDDRRLSKEISIRTLNAFSHKIFVSLSCVEDKSGGWVGDM